MRDEQHAQTALAAQPTEQLQDPLPRRHIEHRGRLVRQQQLRLHRQRPGDGNPLPLTAGELMRELLRHLRTRRQPYLFEQRRNPRPHLAPLRTTMQQQRPRDRIAHPMRGIERPERVLKNHLHLRPRRSALLHRRCLQQVATIHHHLAALRRLDQADDARNRALAAPRLAHQRQHLAARHAEAHPMQHRLVLAAPAAARSERLRQLPNLQHRSQPHASTSAACTASTPCINCAV